jgi:hypothetical protein
MAPKTADDLFLEELRSRARTVKTTPVAPATPATPAPAPLDQAMTPEPEMGKLGAGAYGLGNALTFGQLDKVLPWVSQNLDAVVPGSPYTEQDVQKGLAKAEKDQPWTYAGGRMVGDIARTAPLLAIPGIGPLAAFGAASAVGGSAAEHGINYARGKEDATQALKGFGIDSALAGGGKVLAQAPRLIPGLRGLDIVAREAPGTPAGTIAKTAAQAPRPVAAPILTGAGNILGGTTAGAAMSHMGVPFGGVLGGATGAVRSVPHFLRAGKNVTANINRSAAREAADLLQSNPWGSALPQAVDATKFAGDLLRTSLPSIAQEVIPTEPHRYSEANAEKDRRRKRVERR